MKFNDMLGMAVGNLRTRKLRSWLTILGIVIGVSAVVVIVSLGQGLQLAIADQLQQLGSDKIIIMPGAPQKASGSSPFGGMIRMRDAVLGMGIKKPLTENDLHVAKTVPGVKDGMGMIMGMSNVMYMGQSIKVLTAGIDNDAWNSFQSSFELESGRMYTDRELNTALIGYDIAHSMFDNDIMVNRYIGINGKKFRVVGVLKPTMDPNDARTAYMGTQAVRDVLSEEFGQNELTGIYLTFDTNIYSSEQMKETVENKLRSFRHVTKDTQDFTVTTFESILAIVNTVLTTISLFITVIAAISLLVGAIGITNTMFMSVLERTRQIGLYKALGMTNNEVTRLFLIESGLVGFVGGFIGVMIGYLTSFVASLFGVRTDMSLGLVVFALSFSMVVGILAGLFPARQAASLQPVEALRYE